ncbi:MAG: hypothetical protein GY719_31460 [bacterium]|nr:hypothetical protein [bacterium]
MNKVPIRLAKAAHSLAAAAEHQAEDVDAAFRERVAKVLREGEEAPDVKHLMDVVARLVRYESRELLGVDEATICQGMSVSRMRRQCRAAKAELRALIVDLRERLRGIYGVQEAAEILGFKGRTPRNLVDLHLLAGRILRRLPKLEQPEEEWLTIDPAPWMRKLRPPYEKLGHALAGLGSERWQQGGAHHVKKQVLESFEGTYSLTVRLCEVLCYLAGRKFLGERLRPGAVKILRGGSRAVDEAEAQAARSWGLPRALTRWMERPEPRSGSPKRGPQRVA